MFQLLTLMNAYFAEMNGNRCRKKVLLQQLIFTELNLDMFSYGIKFHSLGA